MSHITVLTCIYQSFRSKRSLNSQGVKQLPKGTGITSQLWSAALTSDPLNFLSEKYPRNLEEKKKEIFKIHAALGLKFTTERNISHR